MSALLGIIEKERNDAARNEALLRMQTLLCHPNDQQGKVHTFVISSAESKCMGGGITINDSTSTCSKNIITRKDGRNCVITAILGNIYNKQELYALIKNENSEFADNSDSGILYYLYVRYGIRKTLSMLDGAFALCIVDQTKQKIYLARDKFGEKPIYYYHKEGYFLFASEYKAFYCYPQFTAELNQEALSEYFIFRYPAGEMTFLKDVYLVKPGTYMEISHESISEVAYWSLPSPQENNLSFDENARHLKELISQSVKRRLISDRTIGVQLSGGVDSSYVAAIMREQYGGEIKSFSIIVDEKALSEEKYIDAVNEQMRFTPHKMKLDASIFLNNWEQATWYYEAPMQHQGNVPLLQLDNEASKEVSILMCGDGADECMGGYRRFSTIMKYRDKWHVWRGVQMKNILKWKLHYGSLDEYFISSSQFLTDVQVKALRPKNYKSDIRKAYSHRKQIMKQCHQGNSIHRYLQYEIVTYMLDTLLRGAKMSTASSLEMRAPLLMTELVEFLQTVPEKYLVDSSKSFMHDTKILLKSLCADVFGESFTYRPKIGLGVPMLQIFSDIQMRNYIETRVLPGIKRRGVVDYAYVRQLWDNLNAIHSNLDSRLEVLWVSFSFEIWAQMYLDNSPLIIK